MRLLKLVFISAIFLFAVITAISLLIPSHIKLSKVVTISPQKDSIFTLIKNKNEWSRWNPSFMDSLNQEKLSQINVEFISETDSSLQMEWIQKDKKPLNMEWQLFKSETGSSA